MKPSDTAEPVLLEGGPWDGMELCADGMTADVEIIQMQVPSENRASFYRRRGDSRTYRFIAEDDEDADDDDDESEEEQ